MNYHPFFSVDEGQDCCRIADCDAGFTLVELMVAMVLTMILSSGIYMSYVSYSTACSAQEEVLDLQQRGRIGLAHIVKDLRMASFDPTGTTEAGITNAGSSSITFTMDLTKDGDLLDQDENVTYSLVSGQFQKDDNNAIGETKTLVVDVNALDFVYLDGEGNVTADLNAIRTVQVSILLRATSEDTSYENTTIYMNHQGTTIFTASGDHYRRLLVSTEVACRNQGLGL